MIIICSSTSIIPLAQGIADCKKKESTWNGGIEVSSQSLASHRCIKEITELVENEMERAKISGLSIALVDDKGIIWSEGFGHTDFSKSEEVTADTLFSLQSMNKCFTATAFLMLASNGLIDLDDPIRKHYPEFTVNTIFGNPDDEIAKITFRRMLSHWSGFTHEAPIGNNYDTTPCSFLEHIQSIKDSWLRSPVGSEHAYSNVGIDLVGYIMGLIQKKSYEDVMKELLFTPLGIEFATFDIDAALKQPFARGHSGLYKTPAVQVPMIPAGGLYASANDVAKIISFHLRRAEINGKQVIDEELFDEMYQPQFSESREFGYGLGVYSFWTIKGAKSYAHGGGGYGYSTLAQWIPEYKIGAVILSNDVTHSLPGKIMQKVLELLYDSKNLPDMGSVEEDSLRKLEGTYAAYRQPLHNIVFENGKLWLYKTDGSEIELFPKNSSTFITGNGTRCQFNLDGDGNPKSIKLENNLTSYCAKFNDKLNENPGPNLEDWQKASGIYHFQADERDYYIALAVVNGYLYLICDDPLKLYHSKDNLYFTTDGEAVILERDTLLYRNISTSKVDVSVSQLIKAMQSDDIKYDKYKGSISTLVTIFDVLYGAERALNLVSQAVEIDSDFKVNYVQYGKRLYALGRTEDSLKAFTELLAVDRENEAAKEMLRKIEQRKELQAYS